MCNGSVTSASKLLGSKRESKQIESVFVTCLDFFKYIKYNDK